MLIIFRIAKRFLDTKNFFGGILHVFYAPELETVVETRKKLIQRRKDVAVRIKRHQEDATNLETNQFEPRYLLIIRQCLIYYFNVKIQFFYIYFLQSTVSQK